MGAPAVRFSTEETPEAMLVAKLSTGGGVAVLGMQAALTRIIPSPMMIKRKNRKFISHCIDDKYNAFRLFCFERGFIIHPQIAQITQIKMDLPILKA